MKRIEVKLSLPVVAPLLDVIEKPKPRPASIADSVRKKHGSAPAAAVAAE